MDEANKAFVTGQGAPDPSAFYTTQTMPVKCNESLREDYCRWFTTRERNCEGTVWAQRYGMAHLFHALKDLYQGEIVITGEAAIKPYDQCFLYDSYNDMHGVFEVEQVTHIFSSETGFVTCIVPDLARETFPPNSLINRPAPQSDPIFGAFFPGPKARGCYLPGLRPWGFLRQLKEWPIFSSPSARQIFFRKPR